MILQLIHTWLIVMFSMYFLNSYEIPLEEYILFIFQKNHMYLTRDN